MGWGSGFAQCLVVLPCTNITQCIVSVQPSHVSKHLHTCDLMWTSLSISVRGEGKHSYSCFAQLRHRERWSEYTYTPQGSDSNTASYIPPASAASTSKGWIPSPLVYSFDFLLHTLFFSPLPASHSQDLLMLHLYSLPHSSIPHTWLHARVDTQYLRIWDNVLTALSTSGTSLSWFYFPTLLPDLYSRNPICLPLGAFSS